MKQLFTKILNTLFPEFTNKITWTVVLAGITLLSSSFIEQILRALISEKLKWNLTDGNDAVLGVVVIALALLHNYGFIREKNKPIHDVALHEKLKREMEHDQDLFNNLDKCISESYLKNHIDFILTHHSYLSKDEEPLDYFYYYAKHSKFNFIDANINTAKNELHQDYVEFSNFMAREFFVHGPIRNDNMLNLCLRPNWNFDRGGYPTREEDIAYDKLAAELTELGNKVKAQYDKYRLAVKQALAI